MAGRMRSSVLNRRRIPFDCGASEFEPDHQPLTPHFMEHLVAIDQRGERGLEVQPGLVGAVDDVLIVEGGQRGEAGHHGELIPTEGGRMLERLFQ